jgi:hypothetical protein
MLPGFRFLFAAVLLSMSILVFGLGAAALLRTAHEEFASNPSWRVAPETAFAQQSESTGPVLAMLRVDPLPAEQKAPDDAPAAAAPVEPVPVASAPAEAEKIAALTPEDSSPLKTAKPEIPVAESPAQSEAAPAQAEAGAGETKIAANEPASSPTNEAAPTSSGQTNPPPLPEADIASAKIAALDDPTVTINAKPPAEAAKAKTISAKPDQSVIKKRQARRATLRRRIAAARARMARQAAQQLADPFAQPVAARSR